MDEFFKITPNFDENQASVTGNTEEEENASGNTNDNADENSEANEINDKNKDKIFTIEFENKTLEYQETMNVDIENISSKNQHIWRSINEFIDDSYFKVVKLFPTEFLDQYRNNTN